MKLKITDHIINLKPYKSGNMLDKSTSRDDFKKLINLASNENQLGSSPKAKQFIVDALGDISIYPDTASSELVGKLAEHLGKKPSEIICGSGSDSLLAYIVTTFSDRGDEILTAQGTFIGIYTNTNKQGRVVKTVPLIDYKFDLNGIIDAINPNTKIIYLANPNNPTGTMFTHQEFVSFMTKVPDHILVVLDEAYYLYSQDYPDYPSGLSYNYDNMIVLQTLSKSYGLAGLRIGYAVGNPDLIGLLYKVKLPFEPNNLAQKAALGALEDEEFLQRTKVLNDKTLKQMLAKFDELGVKYAPPVANFVMIVFETEEKALNFTAKCLENGVVVRPLASFGIPNGVRISTGTEEQIHYALNVFERALKEI
jgi:histidinol-phosphate aminotransferase